MPYESVLRNNAENIQESGAWAVCWPAAIISASLSCAVYRCCRMPSPTRAAYKPRLGGSGLWKEPCRSFPEFPDKQVNVADVRPRGQKEPHDLPPPS